MEYHLYDMMPDEDYEEDYNLYLEYGAIQCKPKRDNCFSDLYTPDEDVDYIHMW